MLFLLFFSFLAGFATILAPCIWRSCPWCFRFPPPAGRRSLRPDPGGQAGFFFPPVEETESTRGRSGQMQGAKDRRETGQEAEE